MSRPTAVHLEWARRCLADESGPDAAAPPDTTPAGRVHDKLHALLAPLVGDVGVQLLCVRSAKLTRGDLAWMDEVPILEGCVKLRTALQSPDAPVSTETAAVLYATFFALLTTFIGDQLTIRLVGRTWPAVADEAHERRGREFAD